MIRIWATVTLKDLVHDRISSGGGKPHTWPSYCCSARHHATETGIVYLRLPHTAVPPVVFRESQGKSPFVRLHTNLCTTHIPTTTPSRAVGYFGKRLPTNGLIFPFSHGGCPPAVRMHRQLCNPAGGQFSDVLHKILQ